MIANAEDPSLSEAAPAPRVQPKQKYYLFTFLFTIFICASCRAHPPTRRRGAPRALRWVSTQPMSSKSMASPRRRSSSLCRRRPLANYKFSLSLLFDFWNASTPPFGAWLPGRRCLRERQPLPLGQQRRRHVCRPDGPEERCRCGTACWLFVLSYLNGVPK